MMNPMKKIAALILAAAIVGNAAELSTKKVLNLATVKAMELPPKPKRKSAMCK